MKQTEIFNHNKTVFVLYEKSGVVSKQYYEKGYNVIQIDLGLEPEKIDRWEKVKSDIRLFDYRPNLNVYAVICFPPCTDLAGSGARWWEAKGLDALYDAMSMVDVCFRFYYLYKPEVFQIENPVGRLSKKIGPPNFTYNPCDYAGYSSDEEAYTKRTCLWGEFNIPLAKPMAPMLGSKMHLLPPTENRAELRSKTPEGFTKAFVEVNSRNRKID